MDRRSVIKNLTFAIAATAILPSCMQDKNTKASIALKHVDINADQEKLIANISETIIPKTDTPGAKDLGLPQFVLKMLDDCHTKADQADFVKGMDQFEALTQKLTGKSFAECSTQQRESVLKSFEKKEDGSAVKAGKKTTDTPANGYTKELNTFYWTIKGETLNGYTNSKYFMTKEIVYVLVPGHYNAWYKVPNQKAA